MIFQESNSFAEISKNYLRKIGKETKAFFKRLGPKKILAVVLIFFLTNIGVQGFLAYGLTNAKFQIVDVEYGGNYGQYSLLYTRVIIINNGPTPTFLPKLKLEISALGDTAIEAEIEKIDVPAYSIAPSLVKVKIYHNQAAKRVIKGLLEEGTIKGDVKLYLPVTLFGTFIVGYIPISVPESTIQSALSGLGGGAGGGEGEASTTVAQALGVGPLVGSLVYSIQYGKLKLEQLEFTPETDNYAELYIAASGEIPENLRKLGNITIERLIIDLITDNYGTIASVLIHPTTIATSSGSWNVSISLRLYKDADLNGFINYFISTGELPPGRLTITGDLKVFDIELKDIHITVDLTSLSGMVSASSVKYSKRNVKAQQFDDIGDIISNLLTQNQDFLSQLLSELLVMVSFRNVEYLGYEVTEEGKLHIIKITVGLNNMIGWTFGMRNVKLALAYNETEIMIINIPDEILLKPFEQLDVSIYVKSLEGDKLKQFICSILFSGKIDAVFKLSGDINLLGQWIEGLQLEFPVNMDISSLTGSLSGGEEEHSVKSAEYMMASTLFTILSAGRYRTSQLEDLVSIAVKQMRVGKFDVYEEKGLLKIYVEMLYEIIALPFAIENLRLDVYYKATHLLSMELPSFDLRPSAEDNNANNRIVRRQLTLILSINEDNPYLQRIITSILNGDYSFIEDMKISGSISLYLLGAEIKNMPLTLDGGTLSSLINSFSAPSGENREEQPSLPTLVMVPFPIELSTILPPELLSQLVQIIDITTEPTIIVDGVPVYIIKILTKLSNPTSVTLSIKQLDIKLLKKLPNKKNPNVIMHVYLENPLVAIPRGSDTGVITIKMIANEELESTLDELLHDFKLDVIVNGTISATIGRLSISHINIETGLVTELPEDVIAGTISSIISAFQEFLTIDELLNLIIPQSQEEGKSTELPTGGLGGISFGVPIVEKFWLHAKEYDENVTLKLKLLVKNLTFPFNLILHNITMDGYYGDYLDAPVLKIALSHDKISEDEQQLALTLVLFKKATGFKDFILDMFKMRRMRFTVNFYADFTFLNFRFDDIKLEGIVISLPPMLTEKLNMILPAEFLGSILQFPIEQSTSEENKTSEGESSIPNFTIPLNFFRIEDIEYTGLSTWKGYPAHHIFINVTFLNIFNISLGIENSTIEIYRGFSNIPSIAIYINGTYNLSIDVLESIIIDVYIVESEETEALLNDLLGEFNINMTIASNLNFVIFGVKIDDFTLTVYIASELKELLDSMLTEIFLGSLLSSLGISAGGNDSSGLSEGENKGLELIAPELVSKLMQIEVTGLSIEEYEDYAYIFVAMRTKSEKLTLTIENISLAMKLSAYTIPVFEITLATPFSIVKGEETETQIKLMIYKTDKEQLQELIDTLINFGVMTIDLNLTVELNIFNMQLSMPLSISKLTVNMTEVLGVSSLQDAVWSMLGTGGAEERFSEGSNPELPVPINVDLGAILATIPLTEMIVPLNVTFESPKTEDGATVYPLFVKLQFNNPYKLNLTIQHTIINITKYDKTLINLEILPVFIPERESANITAYVRLYYWPNHDYTKELIEALINGESYEANISGSIKINLFGVEFPTIEIILPLKTLSEMLFGTSSGSSSESGGTSTEVSDLIDMLSEFIPALQTFLTPIMLLAKVNLTEFSIMENDTGAYTHVVIEISGIKAPIALNELKLQVNYTTAAVSTPILEVYITKPLNLEYGEATLDLLIVTYKNSAMEEFLNKLLHMENVTIDAIGNITFRLFRDDWTFNITLEISNMTFNIQTLLPSGEESGATSEESGGISLPMPTIAVGFSLPFTLTDILKIWNISYEGAEKVVINGFTYQKHILSTLLQLTDKFNITIGWSNATITVYNEYGLPMFNISLGNLLLFADESKNVTIKLEIYDTPYVKEFIEQLAQLSEFYMNVTVHFDTLTVFGLTIPDVELSLPINNTATTGGGGETGVTDMTSMLTSLVPIESFIGDPYQLLNILPPLDVFFSNISLENISLYEEPSRIVFEVKVRVYDLLLPININNITATIYYPLGSGNPVLGLEITDDVDKPSTTLEFDVKLYIYKGSPYYSSEAFYKLLHNEELLIQLIGEISVALFGSQIQGVPSYLTIEIPLEFDDIKIGGIDLSELASTTSSQSSSGTSQNDITSELTGLAAELLENVTQFIDNLVKIGNFAFAVVDETSDYVELKIGLMLKFPISMAIYDLKLYLKGDKDLNTEFASMSIEKTAEFEPNEWAPIYFRVRLLKNEYLEDFLKSLLYNWNFSVYADIEATIRLGTITIEDVNIPSIPLSMQFDPDMFSSMLTSNLFGGNTTVLTTIEEAPPVPDMPKLGFDITNILMSGALLQLGYGNWYDPNDVYGGVKEAIDSGKDASNTPYFSQPWRHWMLGDVNYATRKFYVYYLIEGQTYHVVRSDTMSSDIYVRVYRPDGTIYQDTNVNFDIIPDQTGFWKIEIYTGSTENLEYDIKLYIDGATGYENPWNYRWITMGVYSKMARAYPNIKISNMMANLYYLGEYYTFSSNGTPIGTGTYATGSYKDFIGEVYAPKIEISSDNQGEAFITIRLWRVTRENPNENNSIASFMASALLGNISLMITDIKIDLTIFGAYLPNVEIPLKLNISLAFKIEDLIKPNPKRSATGGGAALPFNAVVENPTIGSLDLLGLRATLRMGLKISALQLAVYLVYTELDVYGDDDPQFGWNDSMIGATSESGVEGPHIAKLFGYSKTPYLSGRQETPRMTSAPESVSDYIWLGGGGARGTAETDYFSITELGSDWIQNFIIDYQYDDETEKDSDCNGQILFGLISGEGDMWSLGLTHFKIEVIIFWWVIDMYMPIVFFEVSGDLNRNIAIGAVYGMENYDAKDFLPDATEWWIDPWENIAHGDGCGYY